MKTKHQVYMVFGVVTSDVDIILQFIFHGLTLNMEADIKCQEMLLQAQIERVAAGRSIWQKDCAIAHREVSAVRKFWQLYQPWHQSAQLPKLQSLHYVESERKKTSCNTERRMGVDGMPPKQPKEHVKSISS